MQTVANGCKLLQTVANGCKGRSGVKRTRLHPQTPKVKREPFSTNSGKSTFPPCLTLTFQLLNRAWAQVLRGGMEVRHQFPSNREELLSWKYWWTVLPVHQRFFPSCLAYTDDASISSYLALSTLKEKDVSSGKSNCTATPVVIAFAHQEKASSEHRLRVI